MLKIWIKITAVCDAVSFNDTIEGVEVDIAVMYNDTYVEKLYFVNNIRTIDGGTLKLVLKQDYKSIVKYLNENAAAREKDTKLQVMM